MSILRIPPADGGFKKKWAIIFFLFFIFLPPTNRVLGEEVSGFRLFFYIDKGLAKSIFLFAPVLVYYIQSEFFNLIPAGEQAVKPALVSTSNTSDSLCGASLERLRNEKKGESVFDMNCELDGEGVIGGTLSIWKKVVSFQNVVRDYLIPFEEMIVFPFYGNSTGYKYYSSSLLDAENDAFDQIDPREIMITRLATIRYRIRMQEDIDQKVSAIQKYILQVQAFYADGFNWMLYGTGLSDEDVVRIYHQIFVSLFERYMDTGESCLLIVLKDVYARLARAKMSLAVEEFFRFLSKKNSSSSRVMEELLEGVWVELLIILDGQVIELMKGEMEISNSSMVAIMYEMLVKQRE